QSYVMEIDALALALPDNVLEYIWFDACLMSSVETFHALRRKCRYLVASPTNVLAEAQYDASGIPYSKVLPYLFGGKEELVKACGSYMEHYRSRKYPILRSASITLADAGQLDSLYHTVRTLLKGNLSSLATLNKEGIQVYHTGKEPQVFFDMSGILKKAVSGNSQAYETFENQLRRTVLYRDATDKIINELVINSAQHSGLSMYLPQAAWKNTREYRYYFEKMEWAGVYSQLDPLRLSLP
ncbi:MAG: Clostripain family protein, partial [Dysgonamonadaceae bacterium]|nr:Clostripain family protein [Dysgonamonadaceae bacterium]